MQSPRRGRPFLPGAALSPPPSSRLPSRRRWPLGQSGTPASSPLFPPRGPPGGSEMLPTDARGLRSPVQTFPRYLVPEVVRATAAQLSQPKLRSERSRWRFCLGEGDREWGGWGRGYPTRGCSPTGSAAAPPTAPLSKFLGALSLPWRGQRGGGGWWSPASSAAGTDPPPADPTPGPRGSAIFT